MSKSYELFENALILLEQIAGSKRKHFFFLLKSLVNTK